MDAEEAAELITDEFSHIICVRQKKHVILPVFYITQLSKGVNEVLNRRKNRYDDE